MKRGLGMNIRLADDRIDRGRVAYYTYYGYIVQMIRVIVMTN